GDLYNGFLRDDSPPNLVAALPAQLNQAPVQVNSSDPTVFNIPNLRFTSPDCAQKPQIDDILFQTQTQGAVWARVISDPLSDPDGLGNVSDVLVQVIQYPPVWDDTLGVAQWTFEGIGALQFLSAYNPTTDAGRENCFLETFPLALDFPNNPAGRIPSTATWGLRFNEAMDPDSFSAYDGLRLTRVNPALQTLTSRDYAVTEISSSTDRTRFSLTPHFPLNHTTGLNESYFLSITNTGLFAPTDLAGNKLLYPFAPIEGTVSELSEQTRNGTHVSLFTSADEEAPVANLSSDPFIFAEWGGQHLYLTDRGVITPRPVSRFTQVVERSNLFTGAMTQLVGGVEEPLARYGTLTQMVWRIYDLGMDLFDKDLSDPTTAGSPWRLDINKLNIDVERAYWSPVTGGITFDAFSEFAMRMSHSGFLPDELNNVPQNIVSFPNSGLVATFSANQLSVVNDPPTEVHSRSQGYTLNPGDKIQTSLPTVLMPFPMNGSATAQKRYYTYRDTALINRGAPNGVGANIGQYVALAGVGGAVFPFEADGPCDGTGGATNFYFPGEVQTAALPLLIEFRCYPDTAATTANRLDVSDSQATTNPNPYFRAFSTGGINVEQDEVFVDPDSQTSASGGFDPTSSPIPGVPTSGLAKQVYIGGIDFVVRISRSFSVWLPTPDTLGVDIDVPRFYTPVVEPKPADQPPGTSIQFAFRGAATILNAYDPNVGVTDVDAGGFRMTAVAQTLDAYGDHYSNTPICASGPDSIPATPPQSNWPFKVVNHNSFDANLDAMGLFGNGAWFDNASDINGAQFFQVRASFVSNAETGLSPVLSTFAMGWRE
ncbi:MAG TPA: hypothetical protein PLJ12_05695, partial [Planctomycetota bacterium]|nr:hypothetical protein [Planctomycetota bacterium]